MEFSNYDTISNIKRGVTTGVVNYNNGKQFINNKIMKNKIKNKIKNSVIACMLGLVALATSSLQAQDAKEPTSGRLKQPVEIYSAVVGSAQNAQVSIPIKAKRFEGSSSEFSIQWDPTVISFINVERFGLRGLAESDFDISQVKTGTLHFSWKDPSRKVQALPDGSILFAICFKLKGASGQSSPLSLSGQPIGRITVGEETTADMEELLKGFTVEPASPNPFTKEVTIGYRIPRGGHASIRILDINGQVVRVLEGNSSEEKQSVVWDGRDDRGRETKPGVYRCVLQYNSLQKICVLMKIN